MSLEELGNLRITSVSRRPERLARAAASVFVITAEDIRRSGATTLPEVLRLAPNLQVAQVASGGYAISARGLNGSSNSGPNKLLVMIDGRSIYSPLFSGVFWDEQEPMLADIERIEVISGPGSTLWGVNAVNGVINVITYDAGETPGALASARYGQRRSTYAYRYAGKLGESGAYRVYAQHSDWRHSRTAAGVAVDDAGHSVQAGFRMDWNSGASHSSLLGNVYRGLEGQPQPGGIHVIGLSVPLEDVEYSGFNLTGQWTRNVGEGELAVQAIYDHRERSLQPMLADDLDLVDLQLQHRLAPRGAHSVTWGANYRMGDDTVQNSVYFAFLPARLRQHWLSLFGQDEISFSDALKLTVGARLERNDYSGTEFLPSARLAWTPGEDHLVWLAASRAARAPARLDHDAFLPGLPPFQLAGGPNVQAEVARVFELGYRGQPSARLSWSATLFHADYDDFRTLNLTPSQTQIVFTNDMQGSADGVELWGKYQATKRLRLAWGATALRERMQLKPGGLDAGALPAAVGNDPTHTWQVSAAWDLSANHQLDLVLRHSGALQVNAVPDYTTLDLNFAWKLSPEWALSVAGRNLLGGHVEYGLPEFRAELRPAVSVQVQWEP